MSELPPGIRLIYSNALAEAETRGTASPPPPFDSHSSGVADWLREPVQEYSSVNRYLYGIWESRPDLRQAFPYPLGASGPELNQLGLAECGSRQRDRRRTAARRSDFGARSGNRV